MGFQVVGVTPDQVFQGKAPKPRSLHPKSKTLHPNFYTLHPKPGKALDTLLLWVSGL